MPQISLSLLCSLCLSGLLIWGLTAHRHRFGLLPRVTLAMMALQSVLIGLRWSYGLTGAVLVQGVLAALIPAFLLMTLRQMVASGGGRDPVERLVLYALPAALILISPLYPVPGIDYLIAATFLAYGGVLIYLGRTTDMEWHDRVPFQALVQTNAAFQMAGGALILSGLVDLAVSHDLATNGGRLAPQIVGFANVALLLVTAGAVILVNRHVNRHGANSPHLPPLPDIFAEGPGDEDVAAAENQEAMRKILHAMDAAIIARGLYRDPELSLDRLSRKLVIPSRQISAVVNSQRAMNVSQYINLFRITEAAHILRTEQRSITEVIYEVGFNTKSNFNREFQRIVGMSPSEWRKAQRPVQDSVLRRFQQEMAPLALTSAPAQLPQALAA